MGLEDRVVSFYLLVMPMSEYNGLVEYRICSIRDQAGCIHILEPYLTNWEEGGGLIFLDKP